jgi:GH15 family glucan-1,4-alpha-glucosidase
LIDASLIWLSEPYGVFRADHPLMKRTIEKIEQEITIEGGVKRYSEDTYYGGGQWIILSAFLGLYYVKTGNLARAHELMDWILQQQGNEGFLPEQVLTRVNDPSMIRPWEERWGKVATPLLWSHAMYLIFDDALSSYTQKEDTQYV